MEGNVNQCRQAIVIVNKDDRSLLELLRFAVGRLGIVDDNYYGKATRQAAMRYKERICDDPDQVEALRYAIRWIAYENGIYDSELIDRVTDETVWHDSLPRVWMFNFATRHPILASIAFCLAILYLVSLFLYQLYLIAVDGVDPWRLVSMALTILLGRWIIARGREVWNGM